MEKFENTVKFENAVILEEVQQKHEICMILYIYRIAIACYILICH
jgi:hypothetical protein